MKPIHFTMMFVLTMVSALILGLSFQTTNPKTQPEILPTRPSYQLTCPGGNCGDQGGCGKAIVACYHG